MPISNLSHIKKIKPACHPLLHQLQAAIQTRFGEDLVAFYLVGSVGRGEDIPFISDIDFDVVLNKDVTAEDEAWGQQLTKDYEQQYPDLDGIDLDMISFEGLNQPEMAILPFILKTDGLFLCGTDIAQDFPDWEAGPALAQLLNRDYQSILADLRQDIVNPDETDQKNPNNIAECIKWISKKVLRLGLGIVMHKEPYYTQNVRLMAKKFGEVYPQHQVTIMTALGQYEHPTNNIEEALAYLDEMERTIYRLADNVFNLQSTIISL